MRRDLFRFGDFEEFDIGVVQLHDAIMRAPRVLVPRANNEAGAPIKFPRRIEIADGVHDMVETVRQRCVT